MLDEIPDCPPFKRCVCYADCRMPCVCGDTERALRQWKCGELPPMSVEQREWCLSQIASVEGCNREDYERLDDSELANGVLSAWMAFCRDKGLM